LGSLRPLLGVRPWTASDFALGATLIAPLESAMPFGVLSPAALTDGLPIPDITSPLNDSVLIWGAKGNDTGSQGGDCDGGDGGGGCLVSGFHFFLGGLDLPSRNRDLTGHGLPPRDLCPRSPSVI
jgi:hypothetical protein